MTSLAVKTTLAVFLTERHVCFDGSSFGPLPLSRGSPPPAEGLVLEGFFLVKGTFSCYRFYRYSSSWIVTAGIINPLLPSAAGACEHPDMMLNGVKVELEYKYEHLNI